MSPTDPVSSNSSAPVTTSSTSASAPTDGAAPMVDGSQISGSSTFSSMGNLSQMAPEVAQALAQGIGMNIIRMMKRGAKRMRNIMRTGTPDGSGPPVNR